MSRAAPGGKGILAIYRLLLLRRGGPPPPPPPGPGFSGQSMPSFREASPRRGPDPPHPCICIAAGTGSRTQQPGWAGPVSSRLSSNDPAWAAGAPPPPPQPSAGRPGWQPDRWLERHTWVSDVETPSGPAVFPWEGGRCCQQLQLGAPPGAGGGVKGHGAITEPSQFPEAMGRPTFLLQEACLSATWPLCVPSQLPLLLSGKLAGL